MLDLGAEFRGKPENLRRSLCSADEKNQRLAAATGDENSRTTHNSRARKIQHLTETQKQKSG
jgi:hypothetical protein